MATQVTSNIYTLIAHLAYKRKPSELYYWDSHTKECKYGHHCYYINHGTVHLHILRLQEIFIKLIILETYLYISLYLVPFTSNLYNQLSICCDLYINFCYHRSFLKNILACDQNIFLTDQKACMSDMYLIAEI